MKLSLDTLAVLDAIDRKGSFTAAAQHLDRVPSAITYTVQRLEQELGVKVCQRSTKRIAWTEAGKLLLTEGRALLAQAKELEEKTRQVAGGWEQELRIAYDDTFPFESLCLLIKDYYACGFPTRLRLMAESVGGCWDAVISGRADLAIGACGDPPSPSQGIASRSLTRVEDVVFGVAPHHPLAHADSPISAQELAQHRVVIVSDSSRNLPPRTMWLGNANNALIVPSVRAKIAAVVAGLGVGHLWYSLVAEEVRQGKILLKSVEGISPSLTFSVVWRMNKTGEALNWFLDRLGKPDVPRLLNPTHQASTSTPTELMPRTAAKRRGTSNARRPSA